MLHELLKHIWYMLFQGTVISIFEVKCFTINLVYH